MVILCLLVSADVDFESGIYMTTFQPGQSRSSVCIVIIDDEIREGNEKFRLLLSIPKTVKKKLNIWAGRPLFADVKIIGECSNVSFTLNYYIISR